MQKIYKEIDFIVYYRLLGYVNTIWYECIDAFFNPRYQAYTHRFFENTRTRIVTLSKYALNRIDLVGKF